MWRSEKRMLQGTLAIYPKTDMIDIGPYVIDLYRYLKTELWDNWLLRSTAPPDYLDRYFCYAKNSQYKPKERHFSNFSSKISPEGVAEDIG